MSDRAIGLIILVVPIALPLLLYVVGLLNGTPRIYP